MIVQKHMVFKIWLPENDSSIHGYPGSWSNCLAARSLRLWGVGDNCIRYVFNVCMICSVIVVSFVSFSLFV